LLTPGIAPSWSWLGINGHIRYVESNFDEDVGEFIAQARFVDAELSLESQLTASTVNASIVIQGNAKAAFPIFITKHEDDIPSSLQLMVRIQDENSSANILANTKADQADNQQTWAEAMDWFLQIRTTMEKNRAYYITSRPDLVKEAMDRDATKEGSEKFRKSHSASVYNIHGHNVYGLFVSGPNAVRHVGYWAPDEPDCIPTPVSTSFGNGSAQQCTLITFVGMVQRADYTVALGLLHWEEDKYVRFGLGWWKTEEWNSMPGEDGEWTVW